MSGIEGQLAQLGTELRDEVTRLNLAIPFAAEDTIQNAHMLAQSILSGEVIIKGKDYQIGSGKCIEWSSTMGPDFTIK